MATLKFYLCETELGWVGLVLSAKGLRASTLPRSTREEALREVLDQGATAPVSEAESGDLARFIRALAAGRPASLDFPIDWDGLSPFRRAVLEETMRIPAGETRSYGWLARQVGRPGAARAVGRVMATNPLPLVIPCHRVVAGDGSLHGYGGGPEMKARLLRVEGAKGVDLLHAADSHR